MQRLGRFTVTTELLTEDNLGFFQPFIIVAMNDKYNEKEFFAISPLFDLIEEGSKIPEYSIEMTTDRAGNCIFEAERTGEE